MSTTSGRKAVGFHDRAWPTGAVERLFAGGWPEFIHHDRESDRFLPRIREAFPDLELALHADGDLLGAAWSVPIRWEGSPGDLPAGYTDTLRRAIEGHDSGSLPDTLVVMGAQVRADARGAGIASDLILAQKRLAAARGLDRVICPVRPTSKSRYPLIDIATFASWRRDDGLPLDPWLRTHIRIGGRVIGFAPASQTITGSVAEWEAWTGLALPGTGTFVIPSGLSTLTIDVGRDTGVYTEPNVWVDHSSSVGS